MGTSWYGEERDKEVRRFITQMPLAELEPQLAKTSFAPADVPRIRGWSFQI